MQVTWGAGGDILQQGKQKSKFWSNKVKRIQKGFPRANSFFKSSHSKFIPSYLQSHRESKESCLLREVLEIKASEKPWLESDSWANLHKIYITGKKELNSYALELKNKTNLKMVWAIILVTHISDNLTE